MQAEIIHLRTELKERYNDVISLTAANMQLQRKVDAADAIMGNLKVNKYGGVCRSEFV